MNLHLGLQTKGRKVGKRRKSKQKPIVRNKKAVEPCCELRRSKDMQRTLSEGSQMQKRAEKSVDARREKEQKKDRRKKAKNIEHVDERIRGC